MITALFAGLLALFQIFLTFKVVRYRRANKISMGDNNDFELIRRCSAHRNLTENAPIFLILLFLCEVQNVAPLYLYALGITFVTGRVLHAIGLTTGSGHGMSRVYGMILTLLAQMLGAFLCIWAYFIAF